MTTWKKLKQKKFRVLSEMWGEILYIDPSKSKFWVKIWWKYRIRFCQNLKFRFFKKIGFRENEKSKIKTKIFDFWRIRVPEKYKICTSKLEIRFRFWILVPENWFLKFQNCFLQFLSNLISRTQNSNSAMSKTHKSTFSHQHSNFSSTKILILY